MAPRTRRAARMEEQLANENAQLEAQTSAQDVSVDAPNLHVAKEVTRKGAAKSVKARRLTPKIATTPPPPPVANTKGFPALPGALHVEIQAYLKLLPSVPIPSLTQEEIYPRQHLLKQNTLHAISQTCRALREIYLPLAWKRLEATAHPRVDHQFFFPPSSQKSLTKNSVKLLITAREPTLAPFVKEISIYLVASNECQWSNSIDGSSKTTVRELAQTMDVLPNLDTIQILGNWGVAEEDHIAAVFVKRHYPNIRVTSTCGNAFGLLAACPEVRTAYCLTERRAHLWAEALSKYCHHVESLVGITPVRISYYIPTYATRPSNNLSSVTIYLRGSNSINSDVYSRVNELVALKGLHTVGFLVPYKVPPGMVSGNWRQIRPEQIEIFVKMAKAVLRRLTVTTSPLQEKHIVFTYPDGSVETELIV